MPRLLRELEVAIGAVRSAAQVCQAVQANLVTEDTLRKKDRSPVTVADFASQAVVGLSLADAFGDDPMVAEEDAADLRTTSNQTVLGSVVAHVRSAVGELAPSMVLDAIDRGQATGGSHDRFWTLDPIDGTKGFLRGQQYAIALALIERGSVVLGVLGCPNLPLPGSDRPGLLMTAVVDRGTEMLSLGEKFQDPAVVQVDQIADLANARFCESVESTHSDQSQSAQIADLLGISREPYRIDSQCKYAAVACGDASIYLRLPTDENYREKIWDHAAGMLTVEAAGGKVTDILGQRLDFSCGRQLENNQGIVATNGYVHNRVIAAVAQVLS